MNRLLLPVNVRHAGMRWADRKPVSQPAGLMLLPVISYINRLERSVYEFTAPSDLAGDVIMEKMRFCSKPASNSISSCVPADLSLPASASCFRPLESPEEAAKYLRDAATHKDTSERPDARRAAGPGPLMMSSSFP